LPDHRHRPSPSSPVTSRVSGRPLAAHGIAIETIVKLVWIGMAIPSAIRMGSRSCR
jgi:hypothetical protein